MRNSPNMGGLMAIMNASMAVVFLCVGYLFIGTNTWIDRYPKPMRIYIGLVMIAWALFRGITVWMRYKRSKEEHEE